MASARIGQSDAAAASGAHFAAPDPCHRLRVAVGDQREVIAAISAAIAGFKAKIAALRTLHGRAPPLGRHGDGNACPAKRSRWMSARSRSASARAGRRRRCVRARAVRRAVGRPRAGRAPGPARLRTPAPLAAAHRTAAAAHLSARATCSSDNQVPIGSPPTSMTTATTSAANPAAIHTAPGASGIRAAACSGAGWLRFGSASAVDQRDRRDSGDRERRRRRHCPAPPRG